MHTAEDIDMLINWFYCIWHGSKRETCRIELHGDYLLLPYYIFYMEVLQPLKCMYSNNNLTAKELNNSKTSETLFSLLKRIAGEQQLVLRYL